MRFCSLLTRTQEEPCVPPSLEVGNTFLILSYSKANGQKCLSCGAISHSDDTVFFDFHLNFFKSSLAMHHVGCSFLPALGALGS